MFEEKYKKIILIIIFILTTIFFGYILYKLFFAPPQIQKPIEPIATSTQAGKFPYTDIGKGQIITEEGEIESLKEIIERTPTKENPIAAGGLTQAKSISAGNALAGTLASNGSDVNYYNKDDNKFYTVDKNGNITKLSNKEFFNIQEVTWSPSKNKAILEYPDGANIIYDFENERQITLPSHWKDFNFSNNGDQIVMKSMGLDPNNRWLAITNEDGSKIQTIEALGAKDSTVYPSWSPNNQSVAMYTEGVDFNRQEVFFVGLNGENFKSTVVEGRGFQPKWQPDGKRLLYSVYSSQNEMKPNLWMVDAQGNSIGQNRKSLNIETWAEKCSFSDSNTLYCAVPEELPRGAGIFPELAEETKDRLYKIDLQTGIKKLIATTEERYNMSNIIISQDEENLFFTDQKGVIHKIRLK